MGQDSKIEWTTHTFNPWRGCQKVSPGCAHCYAETLSKRNPSVLGIWGADGTRVVAAEAYWQQPLKWDAHAGRMQAMYARHPEITDPYERPRVFCASLADVFEDRPELHAPRLRLLDLICRTPNLDWLLLTKRPANVMPLIRHAVAMVPGSCAQFDDTLGWASEWICGRPPANVWLGASVEDQARAQQRGWELLKTPAAVRFFSMEPLLGGVDMGRYLGYADPGHCESEGWVKGVDWVIVGGESGPGARPMHPDWARSIRDQCVAAGVPFFFKQWGEWLPWGSGVPKQEARRINDAGQDITTIPELHCGEEPFTDAFVYRVSKRAAGRMLDGGTWDEFPNKMQRQ